MANLKHTDDKTLIAKLVSLSRSEKQSQVEILRCLAEIDERQIVVEMGYSGLWDFCRRALHFSESTSTRRINVARAARQYPELLAMLEDGRLTLCTAADLVPLLNPKNHEALLAAAAFKPRREVQRLGVPPSAKPVEKDVIRRVPAPEQVLEPTPLALTEGNSTPPSDAKPAVAPRQEPPQPILHRVSFTAEDHVVAKLERLQEILGGATLAEVCDRAAELLLDKVDKARRVAKREKKASAQQRPKASAAKPRAAEPRKPRIALADQVFVEAGMRCSYSKNGVRCTETRYLSIDHVRPYALGGRSNDIRNLRCYCMAHNRLQGQKTFGKFHVQRERGDENAVFSVNMETRNLSS